MLKIFAILSVSLVVGYLLRRRKRLVSICDGLTTVAIWCLLGVLGVSVGSSDEVMGNLPSLLGQAGGICLGAVAGSIVVLRLARAAFLRRPDGDT